MGPTEQFAAQVTHKFHHTNLFEEENSKLFFILN